MPHISQTRPQPPENADAIRRTLAHLGELYAGRRTIPGAILHRHNTLAARIAPSPKLLRSATRNHRTLFH